jgi:hypothetical protein
MRLRTRLLTSAAVVGSLVVPLVPGPPAGAAPTPIDQAVAWLETQQQADGGFEVSGFPGFETPDAVLALAAAGQTTATWSESEALAAVEGVTHDPSGNDALDAVDDWVDAVQGDEEETAAAKASQAAKVIVLVAAPLGLDPTDFDPSGDTEEPVDLLGAIQDSADEAFASVTIAAKAYIAWALGAVGEELPFALLDGISVAQHPDGGFDFTGSDEGEGFDVDITATVVMGLVTSGAAAEDDIAEAIVEKALLGLAAEQRWTGEWAGPFDDGNPNSTALVALMARSLGSDPDVPCWRDATEPRMTGVPFPSPTDAILRRQQADGRVASPSDGFGVNTFATSQAIQGLAASAGSAFYTGPACTTPTVAPNQRIAQAYYVDLLDRVTEPGGAAYWASQFDQGMSPALLAKRFVGTTEYGRVVTERLVEELFDRPAAPEELEAIPDLIRQGLRLELRAAAIGSEEYVESSGSDTAWAEDLYLDAVGRPASQADVAYITLQLQAGRSHGTLARRLVLSAEGRNAFVRDTYRQLLRREPDSGDLAFWSGEVARGVSPERLVTLIIGSAEYKNSTQA